VLWSLSGAPEIDALKSYSSELIKIPNIRCKAITLQERKSISSFEEMRCDGGTESAAVEARVIYVHSILNAPAA
jgi:hypothetical protein